MCKRTDTGFDYGDEGFISFEEAVDELTQSYVEADEDNDFTREEHEEYARQIIDSCEDGVYL